MKKVLKIHPEDNVLIALTDLIKDEEVVFEGEIYIMKTYIPAKHKFVMCDLVIGDPIIMYGVVVGQAEEPVHRGEPITTQNMSHKTAAVTPTTKTYEWEQPDTAGWKNRTFLGYHRHDGGVGVANYWLVAPLVFCENRNIDVLRESMLRKLGYPDLKSQAFDIGPMIAAYREGKDHLDIELSKFNQSSYNRIFPNVDGIKFITHHLGCGGDAEDAKEFSALLAGYIANPNVAGATIIGLGCQDAEQRILETILNKRDPEQKKPVFFHEQQKSESEEEFISSVIKSTFSGLIEANKTRRSPAPISKLVVGLECGGSDGFSGISANPALGYAADLVNALGGTTILSEFPELHGIEQELIHRCENDALAQRFYSLMKEYSNRAKLVGSGFESNPSPGNIKDGLITDAMKSAGAAKKGGTAPVVGVLDYTERVRNHGLNLLCTPGGDVESTTAMTGSGANIIVFTTGLGTPTGNPVAPVVKVSTNTELYDKMRDIIDVDAGGIIHGKTSIKEVGEEILEFMLQVASGKVLTRAQQLGQEDFIPWKRRISL